MDDNLNANLSASLAIQEAQTKALLALVKRALDQLGLQELDGLTLSEWLNHRQSEELVTTLLRMEDYNPAAAALVQEWIEKLVARTRKKHDPRPRPDQRG